MSSPDKIDGGEIAGGVFFMTFCLTLCGVTIWHVTRARKTGRIFRFSRQPIGGSMVIDKKDDPEGFLFATIMGYCFSAGLVFAAVLTFLAIFFPSVLRSL
jgi:hypothetical protein